MRLCWIAPALSSQCSSCTSASTPSAGCPAAKAACCRNRRYRAAASACCGMAIPPMSCQACAAWPRCKATCTWISERSKISPAEKRRRQQGEGASGIVRHVAPRDRLPPPAVRSRCVARRRSDWPAPRTSARRRPDSPGGQAPPPARRKARGPRGTLTQPARTKVTAASAARLTVHRACMVEKPF